MFGSRKKRRAAKGPTRDQFEAAFDIKREFAELGMRLVVSREGIQVDGFLTPEWEEYHTRKFREWLPTKGISSEQAGSNDLEIRRLRCVYFMEQNDAILADAPRRQLEGEDQ